MGEWKLIATAPKDGRNILVWASGEAVTVRWGDSFRRGSDGTVPISGWMRGSQRFDPTHWQSLEPPPS